MAFAKAYLNQLQQRSFENQREYCGYFGYDPQGRIVAVKPRRGTSNGCVTFWPRNQIRVFASYHTHGAWDKRTDGEVPSVKDIEGDRSDGVHGYISTPGGRLWFVDGPAGTARLLCGRDCLHSDPNFRPDPPNSIPESFTLDTLRQRQGG